MLPMQGSGRFWATHDERKYISLSNWRSVRVWASILVVVCSAGYRVFVGEEGDDEIEDLNPML